MRVAACFMDYFDMNLRDYLLDHVSMLVLWLLYDQ